MFKTASDLIESGQMTLKRGTPDEIVLVSGASWKCPTYVRKLPPCRLECPSSEDIRGYITTIAQSELYKRPLEESLDQAWYLLTDKNPMPATHGRICPHPCESGCNRKHKEDGAVAINNMERFIGDHGLKRGLKLRALTDENRDQKVAVVGSGPAGLSCAYQLARRGYRVTIFEAFEQTGGMLRYGIPSYRLPKDVLDAEIQNILDCGVELKTNTKIGVDISFEKLRGEFDAVFMGIGAHKGAELGVPGEDAANVFTAASYLNRVLSGATVDVGNKVVVIGGGDSAVDAARTSLRYALEDEDAEHFEEPEESLTDSTSKAAMDSARVTKRMGLADVTILYRRTRNEMPAIKRDIDEAMEEGVIIEYLTAPVEVVRDNGRATAVKCIRMELGEADSSGRRRPEPIAGSEFTVDFSSLIVGIGQKPDLVGDLDALRADTGWMKVNQDSMQTGEKGVFAGGDVLGLGISTRSVGEGRKAAIAIDDYLGGRDFRPPPRAKVVREANLILGYYPPAPRNEETAISIDERGSTFKEIYETISEDQAVAEAQRCMSCGLCFVCDQCRVYCPREAIEKSLKRPHGKTMFTDYTKCNGCHVCAESCPCGYIEMGMGL